MPPFGQTLKLRQIRDLVEFLNSLLKPLLDLVSVMERPLLSDRRHGAGGPFGSGCNRQLRPALRVRHPPPLVRVLFTEAIVERSPAIDGVASHRRGRRIASRTRSKSLGHEFRQRSLKSPKALAALQPISLISPSSAARRVGTSGSWSVVEATHDAPAKHEAFSQTQTSYGKSASSPSRTRLAPWLLLAIAVAVTVGVIAARLQSSARRGVGHF